MPLPAATLESLIRAAFPHAQVALQDLAGDNDHYAVTVTCESFRGKSRLEQHRMVFDAIKGHDLHALQVKTVIPD